MSSKMVVFCCIAGFRPEKGHKILIDAFNILCDDGLAAFNKYLNRLDPPLEQNDINAIVLKHKIATNKETRDKVNKIAADVERKMKGMGK